MKSVDEIVEVFIELSEDSCDGCPVEKCQAFGTETDEICRKNFMEWLLS